MSKPSDFSPSEALEMRSAKRSESPHDGVWKMRILGLILLVVGWIALSIPHFGSTQWVFETIVLACLGAYAFIAAAKTRRTAVTIEKKRRLDLLVHNVELENMAMRDDLTQLFNRRYFFERLERELEAAKGFNRPLSVIVIDLDSMKLVNDTYGHRVGDEVLTGFGALLLKQTRTSDVPARIGGDEFAIILPDTDETSAHVMIERLTAALTEQGVINRDDSVLRVKASLGLACFPGAGDTADRLMQQADAAMYAEKRTHKAGGEVTQQAPAAPSAVRSAPRTESVPAD